MRCAASVHTRSDHFDPRCRLDATDGREWCPHHEPGWRCLTCNRHVPATEDYCCEPLGQERPSVAWREWKRALTDEQLAELRARAAAIAADGNDLERRRALAKDYGVTVRRLGSIVRRSA